jgi:hypothetical protein
LESNLYRFCTHSKGKSFPCFDDFDFWIRGTRNRGPGTELLLPKMVFITNLVFRLKFLALSVSQCEILR